MVVRYYEFDPDDEDNDATDLLRGHCILPPFLWAKMQPRMPK
jgi:hypothetical protein